MVPARLTAAVVTDANALQTAVETAAPPEDVATNHRKGAGLTARQGADP